MNLGEFPGLEEELSGSQVVRDPLEVGGYSEVVFRSGVLSHHFRIQLHVVVALGRRKVMTHSRNYYIYYQYGSSLQKKMFIVKNVFNAL